MGFTTRLQVVVRSTEIDVNGHVNHAKYLEYLEWGREDWYEQSGFDYQTLFQMNVVTVVVHASVDYRREAFQNDQLTVHSKLKQVGNTSFVVQQFIDNQHNERVIDAEFVIVAMNPNTRKKTPVPPEFHSLVDAD